MDDPLERPPQFHFKTALVAMVVTGAFSGFMLAITNPAAYSVGDWIAFGLIMSLMLLGLIIFFESLLQ